MAEERNMEKILEEGYLEVGGLEKLLYEQILIDDDDAVLKTLDDKRCTYSEGYLKRQPLYSCLTCIPEAKTNPSKAAGVCLACCSSCHKGHDLVELYTKRNFRCDCGNSKFPNRLCNLDNSKDDVNELNQYNHNFTGVYCTCKSPHSESTIAEEMIQCVICEDWFHSHHLGVDIPAQSSFSEMSCEACVKKHPFLLHYVRLCVSNTTLGKSYADKKIGAGEAAKISNVPQDLEHLKPLQAEEFSVQPVLNSQSSGESKHPDGVSEAKLSIDNSTKICRKPKIKSDKISSKFWTDVDWRKKLCNCPECLRMYEEENVMFLLDPQDTLQVC